MQRHPGPSQGQSLFSEPTLILTSEYFRLLAEGGGWCSRIPLSDGRGRLFPPIFHLDCCLQCVSMAPSSVINQTKVHRPDSLGQSLAAQSLSCHGACVHLDPTQLMRSLRDGHGDQVLLAEGLRREGQQDQSSQKCPPEAALSESRL